MTKQVLLVIVIVLLQLQLYPQQQENLNPEKIKKAIQSHLDSIYDAETDFGGATIGIVLPDDTVLEFAIGLSDIANNKRMRPDHLMLGGSTGKIFVSTAIMQLVEDGALQLDDPLKKYLGKLEWYHRLQNANSITLRNLLQHASGISRYVFEPDFQEDLKLDADRVWLPEELLSYVLDKKPLFSAGSDFSYSDTNYILLGMVIEKVTQKTLYNYVDHHIIKPMQLNRVSPQINRVIDQLAVGYSGENDPFYPGKVVENGTYIYNLQFEWTGGGFVNNSRDLARVAKLVYENKLFGAALMTDYLNGVPAKGLGGTWGLGVHITNTPVGTSYGHSGFFPGYVTNMLYFPDYQFSIAFQVNTSDGKNLSLYRKLHTLIPKISNQLNSN